MIDELGKIGLAVGGALASKDTINKLLGPTADYFGHSARDLVQKSAHNVHRILIVASQKLRGNLDQPGGVNARVLKTTVDEGRFIEDPIGTEYFGGLLASSRTELGQDDSAMPLLHVVQGLSTFQLRLHYILYSALAAYPFPKEVINSTTFWVNLHLFIPERDLKKAVGFDYCSDPWRVVQAMEDLAKQRLIEDRFVLRTSVPSKSYGNIEAEKDGLLVALNRNGAALFLRALGFANADPDLICSVNVEQRLSDCVKEEVQLPEDTRCHRIRRPDPMSEIRSDLEGELMALESTVEDVKDSLDQVQNELGGWNKRLVTHQKMQAAEEHGEHPPVSAVKKDSAASLS